MKTLLSVIPYYFSERDFYEMYEPVKNYPREHFWKSMPEWCIRDNGKINLAEHYHQFTGTIEPDVDGESWILFDANPVDGVLQEEISNVGLECLFENYNWQPLFEKIPINNAPLKRLAIPDSVHVVVDLEYTGAWGDIDLVVEVLGYLDKNMNLCNVTK